jgi:hypothetical protein
MVAAATAGVSSELGTHSHWGRPSNPTTRWTSGGLSSPVKAWANHAVRGADAGPNGQHPVTQVYGDPGRLGRVRPDGRSFSPGQARPSALWI